MYVSNSAYVGLHNNSDKAPFKNILLTAIFIEIPTLKTASRFFKLSRKTAHETHQMHILKHLEILLRCMAMFINDCYIQSQQRWYLPLMCNSSTMLILHTCFMASRFWYSVLFKWSPPPGDCHGPACPPPGPPGETIMGQHVWPLPAAERILTCNSFSTKVSKSILFYLCRSIRR
jgi:hypothetical protein